MLQMSHRCPGLRGTGRIFLQVPLLLRQLNFYSMKGKPCSCPCSRGIGTAGRGAPKKGLALSDSHARAEGFQNLSKSFIKHKMNLQAFIESKV